jgi:peptide/nickel transport system substrate-binding protein
VKWHDELPLTADDVIFTINAIQDQNYQSPLEPSMRGVTATKIDDYTLTLKLKEPFAPFLSGLTFGILPQHIWAPIYATSAQTIALSEYNIRPIGSGQWQFSSLVKDAAGSIKSYIVVPFTQYYGDKPYLEQLTFQFFTDTASAVTAVQSKQIDGLSFISPEQKAQLETKAKHLGYYQLKLPQYTAIFFNEDHSAMLAQDKVRQALVWGVDRNRIMNEALHGVGEPLYAPILPGYLGYNSEIEKYGFDVAKGSSILDEAGWKIEGENQYRTKDGKTLEFSIATINQPQFLKTLDILKENWTKMGIKVNVNVYEPNDIQEQIIKPRQYEALLFGEVLGVDPDPYAFWHSTQMKYPGLGLAVFYQKNIDDLLETARKTNDEEQRRLKYFHFQNILATEIPAIFLYNPYYSYVIRQDIQGVTFQYINQPSDRFADIAHWYIKTQRVKKQ